MGIVEEFEELKPILQEKWLDFYSQNRNVIFKYLTDNLYHSGILSSSYVKIESILAILISIEPKLSISISNYMKVCGYLKIQPPTINNLLDILGINSDTRSLDKQLKEREEKMNNQIIEPLSPLDEFRT